MQVSLQKIPPDRPEADAYKIMVITLSDIYRLLLPVGSFIFLT